jgi:5'-phosphate synthase pdxT subunit
VKIGVLALQGDFELHAKALARCRSSSRGGSAGGASGAMALEVEAVEVRKPEQLAEVDGLIMPGGESTTLLKLMDAWGFVPALEKFHAEGRPIFGTCAGLILLARDVESPKQFSLGFIDVGVDRNAYGRQRESFEARGSVTLEGRSTPVEMVFIRAPRIRRVGAGVETLARHRDEPVMARQGSILVATFHPELTDDPTVHEYFCHMVRKARTGAAA